jgi:hypothetical protein
MLYCQLGHQNEFSRSSIVAAAYPSPHLLLAIADFAAASREAINVV